MSSKTLYNIIQKFVHVQVAGKVLKSSCENSPNGLYITDRQDIVEFA